MAVDWPFATFIAAFVVAHFFLRLALGLGPAAPDLLLVGVLLATRRLPAGGAAALGFFLGLLQDALAIVGFGASAVILTLLGYVGARSRDLFVGDSLVFTAAYLFVGIWVFHAAHFLLVGRGLEYGAVSRLLVAGPLAAAYGAAVGVVLLGAYRLISGER